MGLKNKLIELGDMPNKHTRITITDRNELCAENCRCVFGCDENLVVLSMNGGIVRITGTDLVLENFGAYGVKVTGCLHSITMEEL